MSYKSKKSLYEEVLGAGLSDVLMLNVEGPAASVIERPTSSPQFVSLPDFAIGGNVRGPKTCVRV